MYFDRNIYKTAGAYYDSTMTAMVANSKPYRIIKRKRENLDDVIYYEGIAQTNDSILRMVNLSESEQLAIYTKYTDALRIKAIEDQKQQEEALKKQQSQSTTATQLVQNNKASAINKRTPPGMSRQLQTTNSSNGASSFYFYNTTTVALETF